MILPRMIIPLLQPCCRHMFVSGIGWRLNIFFSKKGWKFCVALRMVFMLVSLSKTPIDCYLWKRKNCLVTTAWRLFSFFHNNNGNIKWLHDIETHLQNLLAYKTQLLITLFNINIMIFLGMCQKCSQYNNILIHNILVPFLEWIIITIFTLFWLIDYDTNVRKVFQNSYSFLCSFNSQALNRACQ